MRKLFYLMLFFVLILFACSKDDKTVDENKQKSTDLDNKGELTETETEEQGEHIYPLTGLSTDNPVDNRIISVMVNNHTEARPQSGLSEADIVFEILAEAKITRFLALFQSELPEVVGPVRSAREYYFDIANRYDALYVYHGAAGFIDEMIVNEGVSFLNGSTYDNDGHLFKRESFRNAPHNSYVQIDAVYEVAENKGYATTTEYEPLPFLDKEEIEAIQGEPAQHIEIVYSDNPMEIVEFDYDAATGKYNRFNDEEQTTELDSGDAIAVENVFIIETHHEVIDDAGRREIDLESGGNAYLIQKGNVQRVDWQNADGRLIPVKDGQPIGFVPGKTWINVIPSSPSMEESVTITN